MLGFPSASVRILEAGAPLPFPYQIGGLPDLTLRCLVLLLLNAYVGNGVKDLVCSPRPFVLA